jgi:hypothetical protein
LEELVVDLLDEEQHSDLKPFGENPLEVALSVLTANFEAAELELEARVADWLAQNPECSLNFRSVVLDPWQEQPAARAVARGSCCLKRLARDRPGVD